MVCNQGTESIELTGFRIQKMLPECTPPLVIPHQSLAGHGESKVDITRHLLGCLADSVPGPIVDGNLLYNSFKIYAIVHYETDSGQTESKPEYFKVALAVKGWKGARGEQEVEVTVSPATEFSPLSG